jgi:hypothetical protein
VSISAAATALSAARDTAGNRRCEPVEAGRLFAISLCVAGRPAYPKTAAWLEQAT